ncbi:MAG: nucleotidyltransferase domain-containing protein [Treponema sp.]|nr:nucleotidyltransferase domain-containing protein [Treponema sp.]
MNAKLLSKATNILKNAGCTEVYLFGSQATGKAHSGADVDFDSQVDFYNLLQKVGELRKIW